MLVLIENKILGPLYFPCLHSECGLVGSLALVLLENSKHFILMYLHWMVLAKAGYMTYTFPCFFYGVLNLVIKLSCRNLLRYRINT